jgi:hypothetical protein
MGSSGARTAGAAALVAAALGAQAAPARADPAFDTFRDLCVTTRAEASAALAAADKRGWTDMPPVFRDEIAKQGFSGGEGRAKMHNRTLMLMYAGRGAPVIDGAAMPVRVCALGARPSDAAAVRKAAADWAGVPADPALPAHKGEAFAFLDEDGAHKAIQAAELKTPRGRDLIRRGRVAMLFVAGQPAAPLIVYAIPSS